MNLTVDQLLETWRTNNRINLFLIDHISNEGMKCTLSKRGGRNVVRQFAHLHNVRLWHLETRARDLSKGLRKFETHDEPDKKTLKQSLEDSGRRIETFLEQCAAGMSKRRPSKKGVIATLGYLIAHESHHRGSILLTLKECGHNLDQSVRYAIWDWDRM
ncbi:MAG: DinB family protein [Acidobacteriia bacterium]|nr:DinB family protein [Terriglobia bacterium]